MRIHNTEVDHDSVVFKLDLNEKERRDQRIHYLANVTMIDDKVGEIMDALENKGQLDNTVIIFTSDHGDCLTDHGHSQKWTMYDQVTRVPMIARFPKRFPAGGRIDSLVQLMDVGPTILELAGAKTPDNLEAESILSALEGKTFSGREYVFAEQVRDLNYTEGEFQTMVRSREWKLVHFLDEPLGQLFNLQDDPDEFDNLWESPAHRAIRDNLLGVIRDWQIRSQIQTSKWAESWR
jgi:arylsulfatase A-like enzyme